jgi:hypothetical protein
MLTVLTWFWQQEGGRTTYLPEHVNIWADMVRRNLSMPHRIACVTDLPQGLDPDIQIITPPRDFEDWRIPSWAEGRPQCLRRISMFSPDAAKIFGDRFVCMDLDCVVTGPLDDLFHDSYDFRIYRGTAPGRFYNGSMMLIEAGCRPQVYNNFTIEGAAEAGRNFVGSDQAWISHCLGGGEATWGPEHGVHWFGSYDRPTQDTKIIFFPGEQKPWSFVEGGGKNRWLATHYRRTSRGKALILGYGENVWVEAQEALSRDSFDVVIASPEAAAHWPGDVLAIASNDQHAERLARMHGFEQFVFCGRVEQEAFP